MITIYNHPLFLFTIGFIILLLLPFINSTNDQIKETSIDKDIGTPRKNHLYNILKQAKLSSNSYEEEEEIKNLIAYFFKNYPVRRASSFHAMRGKRFIKTD